MFPHEMGMDIGKKAHAQISYIIHELSTFHLFMFMSLFL